MIAYNMTDVIESVPVDNITVAQDRRRPMDREKVDELAESIRRQGLLQPIGVQRLADRYRLIWGAHRFEAWAHLLREERNSDESRAALKRWAEIPAVVYPADLPEPMVTVLEIEENLRRKELTDAEKQEHTLRLAAALKQLEAESRNDSEFTNSEEPKPATGRGHKGEVQKVAERLGVDHGTVRNRVRKAAEIIGEPIDLAQDKPAELTRKADKIRRMAKEYVSERKRDRKKVMKDAGAARTKSKPDLAELVANLNALWSPKDVERYEPTEQQLSMLKTNAPDVVRKLQSLSLRLNYPMSSSGPSLQHERALAAMVKEDGGADPVPEPEQVDLEEAPPSAQVPRWMISAIACGPRSPNST
jgi:ParB-like chromosome segregation protein Spo0J